MVADEHTATSGLGSLLQDETNISQALNDLETRTNINTMAEQLTESQVKTFVYNKTNDVADLKAILGQLGQKIGQTGGMVLNATIQLGVLEKDLQTSNNTLNGVKGLVLVSKSVQLNQITDILQLKKKLSDDINVMKYAFGLTTSIP